MENDGERLPCRTCRTRKVRCSKTTPCSNCERASIECVYDRRTRGPTNRPRTPSAQLDRVKELEALVADLANKLTSEKSRNGSLSGPRDERASERGSLKIYQAELIADAAMSEARISPVDVAASLTGRVIVSGAFSRHVLNAFWASMYDEIGSLNFILHEEQVGLATNAWIQGSPMSVALSCDNNLNYDQSDFLIRAFLNNIDMATRLLHKPTFLRQCNQFRRGVLEDFPGFEYQLAAVWNLALLSLSEESCQYSIGQPKAALAAHFRRQVERGLAELSITTTNRISSLQILLLHITCLLQGGEIMHASSLLGLALRVAQRMGFHRDGSQFGLSPWNTELRRRLWHHILLLDTCCMENYGLDSLIPETTTDTKLPQNVDDATWDTSDSSTLQPRPQIGCTDMTFSLVHSELAALMRVALRNSVPVPGNEKAYFDFHAQVREQCWTYVQRTYLGHLNPEIIEQRLIMDSAKLTYERIRLTQLQPLMRGRSPVQPGVADLETRLFHDAVSYCQHVQAVRVSYIERQLDWVIVRSFCWHALSIMLSTVLRNHALGASAEAKWARERIAQLFIDRPSIDFLRGNHTLWQPLERLRSELELRHFADLEMEQQTEPRDGMFEWDPAWNDNLWNPF